MADSAPGEPLKTPLYDWHAAHGGRIVEFGGWAMPVQYSSIVDEHQAVRQQVGLFDISHMGRVSVEGPTAAAALDRVVTCSVASIKPMQVRYGLVCREDGGILDDVLVYRWQENYALVVNASNRLKIWDWLQTHIATADLKLADLTRSTAMMALQGPLAADVIRTLPGLSESQREQVLSLGYYRHADCELALPEGNHAVKVSRTGYTGEDGFELTCDADVAVTLWEALLSAGQSCGIRPCGLGARDTLRLEAAMPLYGHELSELIDPLTAGLDFAVKLEKPDFIGRTALLQRQSEPRPQTRVGLVLEGRRIAREGATVLSGDDVVGEVTSGTFSPTRNESLSMAYVRPDVAAVGTKLAIDVRGRREAATVTDLPFYRRNR